MRTEAARSRSVERDPSGDTELLIGTPGSSEEEGKAAAGAAVSTAKVAEGATEEVDHAADVPPAAAEEADGRSGKEGRRLSKEDVRCILEMKPTVVVDPDEEYARMTNHPDKMYSHEFIDKSTEIFRDLAESNERVYAEFREICAWMGPEVEEKGYVELDLDDIARRAALFREAQEADEA